MTFLKKMLGLRHGRAGQPRSDLPGMRHGGGGPQGLVLDLPRPTGDGTANRGETGDGVVLSEPLDFAWANRRA